ncbi:MAG TPA: rod shape-determining protein MreD [Vicinamibacterales bacterium]|nr:rod shape-determining protein MreD [Vicinamibacterales bacterium]
MRAAGVLIAIALALALQTTLAKFVVGGSAAVDLVLVAVVYIALTAGPVSGMMAGSVAGLIQDALSTGVIGIGGLSKATVGFVVGALGQQFIVTAALPRLVIFLGATVGYQALFMGIYVLLQQRSFPSPWKAVATQALGNAIVGMIVFSIVEAFPGIVERRRTGRRSRL